MANRSLRSQWRDAEVTHMAQEGSITTAHKVNAVSELDVPSRAPVRRVALQGPEIGSLLRGSVVIRSNAGFFDQAARELAYPACGRREAPLVKQCG